MIAAISIVQVTDKIVLILFQFSRMKPNQFKALQAWPASKQSCLWYLGVSFLCIFIILDQWEEWRQNICSFVLRGHGAGLHNLLSGEADPVPCPFLHRDNHAASALAQPWRALPSFIASVELIAPALSHPWISTWGYCSPAALAARQHLSTAACCFLLSPCPIGAS